MQIFFSTLLYTAGAGLSVVGRTETVAVLEGDSATLVCGTDLTGNPMPSVSWKDSSGRYISRGMITTAVTCYYESMR